MEHLSDFTFVSIGNVTLLRRDSYLSYAKSGLKQDTPAALHHVPLDLPTLFPDAVLRKAEEDVSKFENKGRSHTQSACRRDNRYHPYRRSDTQQAQ